MDYHYPSAVAVFNFFDAPMIAIAFVNLVVPVLLVVSAKRRWVGNYSQDVSIYLVSLTVASCLTGLLISFSNYEANLHLIGFDQYFLRALKLLLLSVSIGVVTTLPIFWHLKARQQKLNLERSASTNNELVVHGLAIETLALASVLMWLVPIIQYVVVYAGIASGDTFVLRALFRLGVALSLLPAAVAGVLIAFYNKANPL